MPILSRTLRVGQNRQHHAKVLSNHLAHIFGGSALAENDDLISSVNQPATEPLITVPEAPDFVVPERHYPWPEDIPKTKIGDFSSGATLLKLTTRLISKLYPDSIWIPIVKSRSELVNPITNLPSLLAQLESLFIDELHSPYSDSQRALLQEADCILVGVSRDDDTIMAYCSARYAPSNTVPGVKCQLTAGGHLVVASGHTDNDLGPFLASAASLYGYSVASFFTKSIVVLRSNNKYVERIFRRAEPVYRSDTLTGNEVDATLKQVVAAIRWVHESVFHLSGKLFGRPMKIEHRFDEQLTMEGLNGDQIVYLARTSSMFYFLTRVFIRVAKRKQRR